MIDVYFLQDVRWKRQGSKMQGIEERRYYMWWSGKIDGVGSVGAMVKQKLCQVAERR